MPTRSRSTSSGVRVPAFAKINLSLRVVGVRPDGYHELRTIFQSIALHDTIVIRRERGPLRLECNDRSCPGGASNLVWRAAAAAWRAAGRRGEPRDVAMYLTKEIPMQAGLGGGSSDAAATLRALARLWRIDQRRLAPIAASLGADVPYFLEGGTVLGLDRGDTLFPLIDEPPAWVTLVLPPFGVSTQEAFSWWDLDRRPDSGLRARASTIQSPASRPQSPRDAHVNDLQRPVAKRHPEIARIVSGLRKAGATHAAMSGSGSAVFGLFATRAAATRAAVALDARGWRTIVTRTLDRGEYRALAGK